MPDNAAEKTDSNECASKPENSVASDDQACDGLAIDDVCEDADEDTKSSADDTKTLRAMPCIARASDEPNTSGNTEDLPRWTGTKFKPVSKLLDDVLADAPPVEADDSSQPTKRVRYPIFLDVLLGLGLLVAVAGFTIGLFKMYITHSAKQHLAEDNYTAAIEILRKNPLPPFFNVDGNDPRELLDQALYSDAMKRITEENDVKGALAELEQIRPGSAYFDNAQEILSENFEPSTTTLTGGVHEEQTAK